MKSEPTEVSITPVTSAEWQAVLARLEGWGR